MLIQIECNKGCKAENCCAFSYMKQTCWFIQAIKLLHSWSISSLVRVTPTTECPCFTFRLTPKVNGIKKRLRKREEGMCVRTKLTYFSPSVVQLWDRNKRRDISRSLFKRSSYLNTSAIFHKYYVYNNTYRCSGRLVCMSTTFNTGYIRTVCYPCVVHYLFAGCLADHFHYHALVQIIHDHDLHAV